jgi:hypothetical protein
VRFDPDLARAILLQVEATLANRTPDEPVIDGYTQDEIYEHIDLLKQARYLDALVSGSSTGPGRIFHVHIKGLTWEGHEFLNAARNDTLWKRAKDQVTSKGGAMTLGILKAVLIEMGKKALGLGGPPN